MTQNGEQFTRDRLLFQYDAVINLHSLSPVGGSTDGGTRVIVLGTGFRPSNWLQCKFDTIIVPARWLTHESILCVTPLHEPGRISLTVTLNGQDFASSDLSFSTR